MWPGVLSTFSDGCTGHRCYTCTCPGASSVHNSGPRQRIPWADQVGWQIKSKKRNSLWVRHWLWNEGAMRGVAVGCQVSRSACLCTGGGIALSKVLSNEYLLKRCQTKPRKKNPLAQSSYKQDTNVITRSIVIEVPFFNDSALLCAT